MAPFQNPQVVSPRHTASMYWHCTFVHSAHQSCNLCWLCLGILFFQSCNAHCCSVVPVPETNLDSIRIEVAQLLHSMQYVSKSKLMASAFSSTATSCLRPGVRTKTQTHTIDSQTFEMSYTNTIPLIHSSRYINRLFARFDDSIATIFCPGSLASQMG